MKTSYDEPEVFTAEVPAEPDEFEVFTFELYGRSWDRRGKQLDYVEFEVKSPDLTRAVLAATRFFPTVETAQAERLGYAVGLKSEA